MKGPDGRLGLCDLDKNPSDDSETAIHDTAAPPIWPRFLTPAPGTEHRELFITTPPTQGVSYFSNRFRSVRPIARFCPAAPAARLLATPPTRRVVQLRVIKDGYDFSSALFSPVRGPRSA